MFFLHLIFLKAEEYDKIIKKLMEKGEVEEWQKKKIDILIKKAYSDCEYYKNYKQYKKTDECPVINKAIVKENYNDMLSKKYNRNTLHKMSTSGSTGTPFEILQNREKCERVLAELIYFNEIAGQYVGDKFIFFRVWTEKNKKSFFERTKQNLIPIDILYFDEGNMKYIVEFLEKKKGIKSTLAYASTYDVILKYIKDNEINRKFSIRSMISSSELLSDETREGIYTKEDFDETLRNILGTDAEITIEYVDEIPVLSSGKFKKTICNYKP